jgi:hypothetical protein
VSREVIVDARAPASLGEAATNVGTLPGRRSGRSDGRFAREYDPARFCDEAWVDDAASRARGGEERQGNGKGGAFRGKQQGTQRFRIDLCVAALVASFFRASDAGADEPKFSRFDVQTVFYISKSDDRNRVDYGIRLDEHCAPTNNDAVFQYWREFENSPPVRVHTLGVFEYIPYGISEQRLIRKTSTGGIHALKLRQFEKTPIGIITKKESDGHCSSQARAVINGRESELTYVYVRLGRGGLTPSVDYVEVHGKDLGTGEDVHERMRK